MNSENIVVPSEIVMKTTGELDKKVKEELNVPDPKEKSIASLLKDDDENPQGSN